MKKTALLFILLLSFTACKETVTRITNTTAKEEVIEGEFLYWNNAAVLKTNTELYGIVIDEKMHELDEICKPLKKDEYDMIPVTIKGIVKKNPLPKSWAELIQIKEIISVSKPKEKENPTLQIKNK